jgi:RHS repeat-associated protein
VTKSEFNGVGWTTKSYLTDGGGDSSYTDADDVTSDAVLSQTEWTFDDNGNAELVTVRERFHDETATGALGTPSTGVKARVSYSASYFDKADRLVASVDVGTNGGSAYTRPGSVPSRSDTVLVTDYGYNAAGWVSDVTDPMGRVNKTFFDLAGRTTKTIENYVDGTVSDADDKTVEYTHHANGQMKTLKALLTGGGYQTTEWVLGITSPIVSNDILKEMRYPDPSSGNASATEKDAYTHNQLSEVLTSTDRNGSVHTITRDILGRITSDAITTLGSGVDGAVRRIETEYDGQGNAYLFTSYDAAIGGNIVNQVQREFNGLGQLTREWQAVGGAVNTSTTPSVQYAHSFSASGSLNHSRLISITYPNGRVLDYNYATGLADAVSRLSSISDGSTTLESYDYLGANVVVKRAHPESGVDLTYTKLTGESDGAAGDKYAGLDAFYRVVDHRWTTSGGTDKDRRQSAYDRDSNRLYADNLVSATNSELYTYDGLNQLSTFARGTLNGTKDGLTGTASRSQSWDFDALGNFDSQTTDGTAQTRSHNKQNEITSVSGATSPTQDANGNLTTDEAGRALKYDAWNRLVEVRNSSNTLLATYGHDGLGRRVRETRGTTTTDLYYSSIWQVLEERVGSAVKVSHAWSPVYVDALIARDRDTDANGSLDERLYVAQDANFNVTALLNASGTVVERFAYDPFGAFSVLDGSWGTRPSSNYAWTYLHQGARWDADAGVYSLRFRGLSPTLGRWLQTDPILFSAGDVHLSRAMANNPTNYSDPIGLSSYYERIIKALLNRNSIISAAGDMLWSQISSEVSQIAAQAVAAWIAVRMKASDFAKLLGQSDGICVTARPVGLSLSIDSVSMFGDGIWTSMSSIADIITNWVAGLAAKAAASLVESKSAQMASDPFLVQRKSNCRQGCKCYGPVETSKFSTPAMPLTFNLSLDRLGFPQWAAELIGGGVTVKLKASIEIQYAIQSCGRGGEPAVIPAPPGHYIPPPYPYTRPPPHWVPQPGHGPTQPGPPAGYFPIKR